ncbi:hypothetical protein CRUP_027997, partial [Coryphaenoides rupestris]
MASLFQRIKELYPDVAKALEKEEFLSDDDIRSLTLEDLLPGPRTLRQRKDVYELQQQATVTLVEDDSDPQIIILFCPIMSRIELDLATAMAKPP